MKIENVSMTTSQRYVIETMLDKMNILHPGFDYALTVGPSGVKTHNAYVIKNESILVHFNVPGFESPLEVRVKSPERIVGVQLKSYKEADFNKSSGKGGLKDGISNLDMATHLNLYGNGVTGNKGRGVNPIFDTHAPCTSRLGAHLMPATETPEQGPEQRTSPTSDSAFKRQEARQRLADAARALSQLDSVKHKLEELKRDAQDLENPDFVWRSLVESLSSMGNSRGYDGLFGNPENYKKITFEVLSSLSPNDRLRVLAGTLGAASVRMPDRKAEWLAADFKQIERMGGPAKAKAMLLGESGRDAKIAFLKKFAGIGDKYARNIFMNVYHPEFRQSIAVDSRIESVLAELDFNALKSYEERERFLLDVAETAGVDGWNLDRMIYHFKDEIFARLNAGSRPKCFDQAARPSFA
jgi:hypothetical protein